LGCAAFSAAHLKGFYCMMAGTFVPAIFYVLTFPGCGAARSDAPLIRDRPKRGVRNDPGSAAHHYASCCARETQRLRGDKIAHRYIETISGLVTSLDICPCYSYIPPNSLIEGHVPSAT
jgi:hypothetical protein